MIHSDLRFGLDYSKTRPCDSSIFFPFFSPFHSFWLGFAKMKTTVIFLSILSLTSKALAWDHWEIPIEGYPERPDYQLIACKQYEI